MSPNLSAELNNNALYSKFEGANLESVKKTLRRLRLKTVENDKGCWLYKGGQDKDGHCTIRIAGTGKSVGIHRYSFHVFYDFDLFSKSLICHKPECNTPNCWNPYHLYEGTASSNNFDTLKAGTNFWANQTQCIHGHEFTSDNTLIDNRGHRACKMCAKLKMQRRRF